ncbi:MAG: hypothetical protein C0432_03040 [Candidatus Puniceispirillum sp.]|nr:hypothetical protein [Candidatus Pelagibacter sp.]MBA4283250.1 hypothetical protein [Candidatus Puniceispirillum sp.]
MALIISTYIFILHLSFFCHSLADTCAVDRVIEITKKIQQQNDSVLEKCEAINNFTYEIPDLRREIKRKLAQHDFEDLLKSNPDIKYAFSININKLSQVTHSLLRVVENIHNAKIRGQKIILILGAATTQEIQKYNFQSFARYSQEERKILGPLVITMDDLSFSYSGNLDESIFIKNDFNDSSSLQWISFVLKDCFDLIIFDPGVAEYFYCNRERLEFFHNMLNNHGHMIIPTSYAGRFSDTELLAANALLSRRSFTLESYISYLDQWTKENHIDFLVHAENVDPYQYSQSVAGGYAPSLVIEKRIRDPFNTQKSAIKKRQQYLQENPQKIPAPREIPETFEETLSR